MHQRSFGSKRVRIVSFVILLIFIFFPGGESLAKGKRTSIKQKRSVSKKEKSTTKDNSIHIVRKGETLYRIAKLNGLSVDKLKGLNGLKNNRLKIGQRLIIEKEISSDEKRIEDIEVGAEFSPSKLEEQVPNKISEAPIVEGQNEGVIGKILSYARDLLGIPYRFGGTTLKALDCSAFVQKVFKSVGIDIPRTAREQFKIGREVERDEISEGDLLFFKTSSRRYPSHVGIYIGDNWFIHASRKERRVTVDSLNEPYYQKRFIGAKRLIELEVTTEPADKDKSG